MFPYTGFREAPLGCDDSSGTIVLCHPFHNPYLILCLLFSVTIEPSSRLLPGLRLLAGGISLSMAPSQRRCRVEKVKGGKSRHSHRVSKLHGVTKMSHTDAEIHFSVLHFRETSFFLETLPDHLQSSSTLIISRRLTSVPKTEDGDALIHTRKQQLQIKRLGLLVFPGTTTNNCGEIAGFHRCLLPLCSCLVVSTLYEAFQFCSPKQQPSANFWLIHFSKE